MKIKYTLIILILFTQLNQISCKSNKLSIDNKPSDTVTNINQNQNPTIVDRVVSESLTERTLLTLVESKIISRTDLDHFKAWTITTSSDEIDIVNKLKEIAGGDNYLDLKVENGEQFEIENSFVINGELSISFSYGNENEVEMLGLNPGKYKLLSIVIFKNN